ncbi:MAG TPA: hypothetical protein VHG89_04640 [Verrucomicrobiae bacterium]|nr:hypothetical protein [Verrucomicrobiae bacterium]
MKSLIILILSFTLSVFAEDASDITTKVFEKHDKDGKVNLRMETVYRGKTKILMVVSRLNKQGQLVVTSRSYLVGGNLVMTESDENRDGFFETVAVYDSRTDDMEEFIRQPDGSVKPVSTQTLQTYKKQNEAMTKFWRDTLQSTNNGVK